MAQPTQNTTTQEPALGGGGGGDEVVVRKKHLGNEKRTALLQALLVRSSKGDDGVLKLGHGVKSAVAKEFGVSPRTVYTIWTSALASREEGSDAMIVPNNRSNCGRKRKEVDLSNMSTIPLNQRTTIRSTAHALGLTTWQVWRSSNEEKQDSIKPCISTLKPALKDYHVRDRIDYAINEIDLDRGYFSRSMDCIHIDEKWFYIKKVKQKYYLAPGEEPPDRSTRHKSHITKVMFLCAVARPRHDPATHQDFDGKIGIWPFVHMVEAVRNSRNRPAGMLEMKTRTVDSEVYIDYICNELVPAIVEKWPVSFRNQPIFIQHDNAGAHRGVTATNVDIQEAIAQSGLDIRFKKQPAQSPDCNVLDLGFFNSIQTLQQRKQATTIPELVDSTEDTFNDLDPVTLNKVWLTHQCVMEQIILHEGKNTFKLPHMNKDRLLRNGSLPVSIKVTDELKDKIKQLRPKVNVEEIIPTAGEEAEAEDGAVAEV